MIVRSGILLAVLPMLLLGCLAAENVTKMPGINISNMSAMDVIIVPEVVSDRPGWIAVRNSSNGTGPLLGLTHVADGIHENVPVFIDHENADKSVFIQLHEDKGIERVFEPMGPDKLIESQSCGSCWARNSWGNSWFGNSWGSEFDVMEPGRILEPGELVVPERQGVVEGLPKEII